MRSLVWSAVLIKVLLQIYTKPLQLAFNQNVDEAELKDIIITEGGADREPIGANTKILSGKWVLSSTPGTIVFNPAQKFKPGMFVSITIPETFKKFGRGWFYGRERSDQLHHG